MEVLSEHLCEGWLEGYLLTGRHGLFATYEAFAMVSASMLVQHTKWLQHAVDAAVARAGRLAERAADLHLLAQRPQRVLATRGRASSTAVIPLAPGVVRIWLPPDANSPCPSPTTACAAPTTSTSSSSTSSRTCST